MQQNESHEESKVFVRQRPLFRGALDVQAFEAEGLDACLLARSPFELLQVQARRQPDNPAIRFVADPERPSEVRQWSYRELASQAMRAANALHELGVRPDKAVPCLMPNTPETHSLVWGATAAGRVAPINFYLDPTLIGAMINELDAELIVIHAPMRGFDLSERVRAILEAAPAVRTILCFGAAAHELPGLVLADAILPRMPDQRLTSGRRLRDEDVAAYFHTGGTTGAPKFACQSHLAQALAATTTAFGMGVGPDDVVFSAMPLFHAGGLLGCGLVPLSQGGCVLQVAPAGYRDAAVLPSVWTLVERHGVTMLVGPPTIYADLGTREIDANIRTVRRAISSAAGLPVEVLRRFERHTGVCVREAYGMTEATLLLTANPPDGEARPGSVGLRLPFVELRICDTDLSENGVRDAPPGKVGRVATRGPLVFSGYLGRGIPSKMDLGDGWIDSGDVGRIEDGYLYLTGRSKDLIIRGGHNIDPSLIEAALDAHPAVEASAAVGRPDAYAGEVPICYVTLLPGHSVTVRELLDYARGAIAERAAVPKDLHIVDRLPLTAVGKVAKNELRIDAARRAAEAALADLIQGGEISEVIAAASESAGMQVIVKAARNTPRSSIEERLHGFGFNLQLERAN